VLSRVRSAKSVSRIQTVVGDDEKTV